MSERHPRIPDIDHEQIGPQDVQVVDESFIGLDPFYVESEVVNWVKSYNRIQRMTELGAPTKIIRHGESRLNKDVLLEQAGRILTDPAAARAFDGLITNYAQSAGQLVELVTDMNPRFVNPERRLFAAIYGENEYKSGDIYGFSELFLDKKLPQADRKRLVVLHAEALEAAETQLAKKLPALRQGFDQRLQAIVDRGILPQSALVDEKKDEARATRLKYVTVFASDPVLNKLTEKGGHYEGANNVIQIDASEILEENSSLEHVYTHEMLHDYSGLTVRIDRLPLATEEDFDPEYFVPYMADKAPERDVSEDYKFDPEEARAVVHASRVGLSGRENAINEAYTEWATQLLLGNEYDQKELWSRFVNGESYKLLSSEFTTVYLPERIMLAGLVAHGVDIMTIGEAYFESYQPKINDPKREPGKTVPARRKLDAAIAEHTPYKSLAHMERMLEVEANERYPDAGRSQRKQSWLMVEILSEKLGQVPVTS